MREEPGSFGRSLLTLWYILCPELALRDGGGSMVSIRCIQGAAKGSREPLTLNPTFEGTAQDVLQLFKVLENPPEPHVFDG